ncbi:MAG: hypothetical protein WC241_05005 [Candidatus Paceibacterota bacterium]|jgi:hypothetical protein
MSGVPAQLVRAIDRVEPPTTTSNVSAGWRQYRAVQATLRFFDEHGYARSYVQKQLHTIYLNAALDIIFRGSWDRDQAAVLMTALIASLYKKVAVAMPRRFGKTYSIAMFVAALMCSMTETGIKVIVYSSGSRASTNLAQTVRMFLEMVPGAAAQITVDNFETIVMRTGPTGPIRSLKSLPSAVCTPTLYSSPFPLSGARTYTHIHNGERSETRTRIRAERRISGEKNMACCVTADDDDDDYDDDLDEYEEPGGEVATGGSSESYLVRALRPAKWLSRAGIWSAYTAWKYTGYVAYRAVARRWDDRSTARMRREVNSIREATESDISQLHDLYDKYMAQSAAALDGGSEVHATSMYACAKTVKSTIAKLDGLVAGLAQIEAVFESNRGIMAASHRMAGLKVEVVETRLFEATAAAEVRLDGIRASSDRLHLVARELAVPAGLTPEPHEDLLRELHTKLASTPTRPVVQRRPPEAIPT